MTGRNFFKVTFKVTGISISVLIIVTMLFLSLFDFGVLKPKVETVVSEAIGREFNINGELSFKLLPTPTLLVEDVTLANANWSSDKSMLDAGKAYLKVNAFFLLLQQVVIEQFELADVHMLVESGPDEQLNWDLAKPDEEESEQEKKQKNPTLVIESASLDKIKVIYRQTDSDDVNFVIDSLRVNKNEDDETKFDAKAEFTDIPLSVTGVVTEDHTELNAVVGKVKLSSQYDYLGESVDFSIVFSTLSELGGLLDIEGLPKEDLSLEGKVAMSGGKILLKDIVASMTGARVALDGQVDIESSGIQFEVQATGETLSVLSPDLPAIPFSLNSDLKMRDKAINAESFTIKIGDSTVSGKAHLGTGNTPAIRIEVHSDSVYLSPFLSEESLESNKLDDRKKESEQQLKYVFDETPLPFDTLQRLNLDVSATIGSLVVHNNEIKNFMIDVNAKQGVITLKNAFIGVHNGKYDTDLALTSSGKSVDIKFDTAVRDFKVSILSGDTVSEDQIPITNIDINLRSIGSSPRTLASNLDGKIVVNQGKGRISNKVIGNFSGDILSQLFSALNPFSKDEEYTNWECSLFVFNFESGYGDIDGFLMQSEKLMAVGGGSIDLNDEALNIEFNTKPRKGVGVSAGMFVTPFIKLSGTLAQPSVGLNKKGVLLNGGAAVLTGGMSFLYTGMKDRVVADAGQCEQAITAISNTQENPL